VSVWSLHLELKLLQVLNGIIQHGGLVRLHLRNHSPKAAEARTQLVELEGLDAADDILQLQII